MIELKKITKVVMVAVLLATFWVDNAQGQADPQSPRQLVPEIQKEFNESNVYIISEDEGSKASHEVDVNTRGSEACCSNLYGWLDACGEDRDSAGLLDCLFRRGNGVTVDYLYTSEIFNNMRGGLSTNGATAYTGRFDLVIGLDLDELQSPIGGKFLIHAQQLSGQGITDRYVGTHQRVSNIDGNPGAGFNFAQVTQYWWENNIIDGLLTVRVGKILCDSEFALASLGGDFINTSLGWTHTIPMPAYPNSSAGAIVFVELNEWLGFKAGVWDGAPDGGNWGFSETGDVFSIYQFTANYELGECCLHGDMHIGMWYHNGEFADQANGPDHTGNHGVFWSASQMLTRENPCVADDPQGLGTFLQFGWSPAAYNVAEQYWGGGLVYKGLFCGRDEDTCGIGIGNMTFGNRIPATSDETMIELFYKARIGPHWVVQPDFQYIANPNGMQSDAFVIGLRFQAIL